MNRAETNNSKVRYQTVIILKNGKEWFTDEEWKWKSEADQHGRTIWKANMDKVEGWHISTYRVPAGHRG